MRLLAFILAPLLVYSQTPSIISLDPVAPSIDKNNLLTVGGERLFLRGTNFGSSGAVLTYTGPSPFQNGFTVRYSPMIQFQNDTLIEFTTSAGIGANLQISVTRKANNATFISGPLASYSPPSIQNITGIGITDPYALKPQGGETLRFFGKNFGPRTYPGYVSIYTPWVRFGGIPGTWAWMQACSRTAIDFDSLITCRTPVGGGTNHSVRINAGYTGQWSPVDRNKTVSFVTPTVLSTTPTFTSMTTAGGDQIVIRGLNMPYPSWVIQGYCPISASFGPYNTTILTNTTSGQNTTIITSTSPFFYKMSSCTGAFDGDGRTPVITCLSPPGTGRGYILSVNVGGLFTNLYVNKQIGYAPPVIYDFSGANLDASTVGNQTVFINGRNFGNNSALVSAKYNLNLKSTINSISNYIYTSPYCNITIPNLQLGCTTAPGVGEDLTWVVTVNGQDNINPKTAYTTPKITGYEVRNATTLQIKSRGASTNGGDILFIYGSGFGPGYLNLIKDVIAISPFGLTVPVYNDTLISDNLLTIKLPPGGGTGWSVSFKVADVPNELSFANYSYANPIPFAITPVRGPTSGGIQIILYAQDLSITNPSLITGIVFGNPSDSSVLPYLLPASLVPRPDSDNTTKTPYLPGLVSFRLPQGSGLQRYIRLVTYLNTDTPPDPTTIPLENGISFDYSDPVIINAVLSQPSTPQQLQEALNFFGADEVSSNRVRVLTLFGENFGQGTYPLSTRGVQILNGTWQNISSLYQYDPTGWSDTSIQLYTLQTVGVIRLVLGSLDIQGNQNLQISNSFTYNDFSPVLNTNTSSSFPTVGGTVSTVSALYLSSAISFNITVAGNLAIILDPSTGIPLNPQDIYSRILTNPACYSPPGSFTPSTVWTFQIQIPPGQGSSVPTQIIRFPDGSSSAPSYISYIAPTLSLVNGQLFDPYKRYVSPTPGSQFIFSGTNFGPCPTLQIATYSIQTCVSQPGSVSISQTQITIEIPEGEGTGIELLGIASGWTIQIQAGDQSTTSILFGWQAPDITQVVYTSLPTIGGTLLTLQGVNFGASVPGYPQASLPLTLQIQVFLNSTYQSSLCLNPQRLSHTQIQCQLPPGGGSMDIRVQIAGQLSASKQTIVYNPPLLQTAIYNSSLVSNTTIRKNDILILQGSEFGPSPQHSCVFFSNRYATQTPICNGQEDFPGEGEQPVEAIQLWNHTHIFVTIPIGTGSPFIRIAVWGQYTITELFTVLYSPPLLYNTSRNQGPASGGYPILLYTENVGFSPTSEPYPRTLPATYFSPIHILMNGFCISSIPRPGCQTSILSFSDSAVNFIIPEGVGGNYSFTVVIDDPFLQIQSNTKTLWSYDPPIPTQVNPNPVIIGVEKYPSVIVQGDNFGTPQAFLNFPTADSSMFVYIYSLEQRDVKRISTQTLPVGIQFTLDSTTLTAGKKELDIRISGQTGILKNSSFSALNIVCEKDYFANDGESCLVCPTGGICPGNLEYPYALPGFFNLNSSYPNAEICPASASIKNVDGTIRDVCLVACSPVEACVGKNLCATGYTSTSPGYRCNTCQKGFYKRANECIRCPDSPIMVIIGCILIVITLSVLGFFLNKKNVNLAFLSIAIDYFQIISIFLQSKVAWPAAIKNFMYILSAFNLNLDIVAPECLVPDISYSQKFYFIQLLPISLFGFLFLVNIGYILYKALILGRSKKELWGHISSMKATGLIIMYFLYLYITRTLLDVFNCSPTIPPTYNSNGQIIKYLSVQFEECGKPDGLQMKLMPVAILGLLFYSIGFPVFIGYVMIRYKDTIMFDQLLRAQEEGSSRFENPIAYDTRKSYGRLYYQYKPDYYYWSLMILGRKFCIAVTSVMFASNSAFQMAACLLILFISYALQTRFNPLMCYSDYEDVIRSHLEAISWSKIHMQVHAMLLSVNAKNKVHKKRYRNSIMNLTGKIDRIALFKSVGSWLFNYNTVEAIMLFCGVIISLMGIMYQSQTIASGWDSSGYDIITGVVLFVMISSILYLFTVFGIEIYIVSVNTNSIKTAKVHGAVSSKKLTIEGEKSDIETNTETNPMMINARFSKQINVDDFEEPPPSAIWPIFKELFKTNNETIKTLNDQIASLKKDTQRIVTPEFEMSPIRIIKRELKQVYSTKNPLDSK